MVSETSLERVFHGTFPKIGNAFSRVNSLRIPKTPLHAAGEDCVSTKHLFPVLFRRSNTYATQESAFLMISNDIYFVTKCH